MWGFTIIVTVAIGLGRIDSLSHRLRKSTVTKHWYFLTILYSLYSCVILMCFLVLWLLFMVFYFVSWTSPSLINNHHSNFTWEMSNVKYYFSSIYTSITMIFFYLHAMRIFEYNTKLIQITTSSAYYRIFFKFQPLFITAQFLFVFIF